MGMTPAEPAFIHPSPPSHLAVQLDGRMIGYVAAALAPLVVQRLHSIKAAALALQEGSTSSGNLPTLQVPFVVSPLIRQYRLNCMPPLLAMGQTTCHFKLQGWAFQAV